MPYSPLELAEAFLKTGELSDALDALNEHLSANPLDDEARRLRVQVRMHLADPDQLALALQDLVLLAQPVAMDYWYASIIQERLGNRDAAFAALRTARTLSPQDARLIERELTLLLAAEQYTEALALVREQPHSWGWLEREGDILALLGDDVMATARYGLVLALLEDAADTIPADHLRAYQARVLLVRAHAYRRLHHIEQARMHYQAALDLLPDDPAIRFNLGVLEALEGHFESAVTICRSAWQHAPAALRNEMLATIQPAGFALLRRALSDRNEPPIINL